MLSFLEILAMKKEIVTSILFIGFIYGINYFIKNTMVKKRSDEDEKNDDQNFDEILDEILDEEQKINTNEKIDKCDIQLQLINNLVNNKVYSKSELEDKKQYLMELNKKLVDIQNVLNDIKNNLNSK